MKKFLAIFLAVVLAMSLVACNSNPDVDPTEDTTTTTHIDETNPNEETTNSEGTEPEETTTPIDENHEHTYSESVVQATCTENGYTTYECECGDTYNDNYVDALGHVWGDWATVKESTEKNKGKAERSCTRESCDAIDTRDIPVLNCDHNYTPKVTEPTCTSQGYTTYTCSKCNDSYTDNYTERLSHNFKNYASNGNATCVKDGTKTAKCDYGCGTTDTIADNGSALGHDMAAATCTTPSTCKRSGCNHTEGKALGHSFTKYNSNNDATCMKDGTKTAKCDRCDETNTVADTGSKKSHNFKNYTSDNNATCTSDGTKTAQCSYGCGTKDTVADKGSALGHDMKAATCTAPKTCKRSGCGHTEGEALGHDMAAATCTTPSTCKRSGCGRTEGKALGHSFTKYTDNNDATCTKNGTKTAKCDRNCGETNTVSVAGSALGHDMAAATCATPSTCKRSGCGHTEGKALGHSFTKYTDNNDATCMKDGTKTATCDNGCGEKKTVTNTGSKKSHVFTKYNSDNNATCEKDGTKTAKCDYGCGTTDTVADSGSVLGHNWKDATCSAPKTCSRCGKTDGTAGTCSYTTTKRMSEVAKALVDAGDTDYMYYTAFTEWNVNVCDGCGYPDLSTFRYAYSNTTATNIMLGYVNELRRAVHGTTIVDLAADTTLVEMAAIRAKEISVNYSHGGTYTGASAENIINGGKSIYEQFASWKASQGHYNAMINVSYEFMGYAVYVSPTGDFLYGVMLLD